MLPARSRASSQHLASCMSTAAVRSSPWHEGLFSARCIQPSPYAATWVPTHHKMSCKQSDACLQPSACLPSVWVRLPDGLLMQPDWRCGVCELKGRSSGGSRGAASGASRKSGPPAARKEKKDSGIKRPRGSGGSSMAASVAGKKVSATTHVSIWCGSRRNWSPPTPRAAPPRGGGGGLAIVAAPTWLLLRVNLWLSALLRTLRPNAPSTCRNRSCHRWPSYALCLTLPGASAVRSCSCHP